MPDIADAVVASEVGRRIYRGLSEADAELLDIAFMQDVSKDEAAAMLDVSVPTFNTRVSRLRRRIEQIERQTTSDGERP